MSCLVASDLHISTLAAFAVQNGLSGIITPTAEETAAEWADVEILARRLHRLNLDPWATRYPRQAEADAAESAKPGRMTAEQAFRFDGPRAFALASESSAVEILRMAAFYGVQACDSNAWDGHPLAKMVSSIETHAIEKLPGYDALPWGIPHDYKRPGPASTDFRRW